MAKSVTVFASGTVYWASVLGEKSLRRNYDGDGREWSVEFEPDGTAFLKENRLLDRLKDPMAYADRLDERGEKEKADAIREMNASRGDYIILKKPEFNKDGEPNDPFRVYDENNQPWDESRLIGNGSKVDVKLSIVDWGVGKKKSIYLKALRVTEHVPYEADEFAGMDKGGAPSAPKKSETKTPKPKTKAKAEEFEDLDDDIPFE